MVEHGFRLHYPILRLWYLTRAPPHDMPPTFTASQVTIMTAQSRHGEPKEGEKTIDWSLYASVQDTRGTSWLEYARKHGWVIEYDGRTWIEFGESQCDDCAATQSKCYRRQPGAQCLQCEKRKKKCSRVVLENAMKDEAAVQISRASGQCVACARQSRMRDTTRQGRKLFRVPSRKDQMCKSADRRRTDGTILRPM